MAGLSLKTVAPLKSAAKVTTAKPTTALATGALSASPFGQTSTVKPLTPAPAPAAPSPFVNPYQQTPAAQSFVQPLPQPAAPSSPFVQPTPTRPEVQNWVQPIQQPLPFTSAAPTPQPAPAPAPSPTGGGRGAALATIDGSFNQGGSTGGLGTRPDPSQPYSPADTTGTRPAGQAPATPERQPTPMPAPAQPPPRPIVNVSGAIDNIYRSTDNLIGPGTYENWFQQNQGAFRAPSALDDYWNGVKGTLTGQRFQPTYSANAYQGYADYMNGPAAGATNARQISDQQRNQGAGENMMSQAGDMFRGNTAFQDYANPQLQSGWFNSATNAQQNYDQSRGALAQSGAGYNNAMGVLGGMNYGQQAINNINNTAGGAQNVQNLYNSQFPGFMSRNPSQSEYGYFNEGLRGPSYSENLYESGNQGLNTFYDRERDKRVEALETRLAATGQFGSGDLATANYELEGELGAAQARDMASLAQQADAARIARGESARGWAGQIGDEEVARMGLGVEAAGMADQNRLGLMDRQLAGYNLASDEANARAGRYLEADEGERARMDLSGRLAQQADQESRMRRQLGLDTARSVGEANERNTRGFFDAGREMSSAEDRRLNTSLRAGMDADQEERLRRDNAWNASLDMEDQERQWFDRQNQAVQTEGNLAGQVSQQQLQRLQAEGSGAQQSQVMQENRLRNRLQDISNVTQNQINTLMGGLDAREQADLSLGIAEIDNMVATGAISRQQAQQQTENIIKMIETGVTVADAIARIKRGELPPSTNASTGRPYAPG